MRRVLALSFLLAWLTAAVALTYSTQRPLPWTVFAALLRALWALAVAGGLLAVAWALGRAVRRPWFGLGPSARPLAAVLDTAVGLAVLGWVTLALGVLGWARPLVFRVLFGLGGAWLGWQGWTALRAGPRRSWRPRALLRPGYGWWAYAGVLALLLALAPPEGFDALLYHLRQPEWLLQRGRLEPHPVYPFWHPGLVQGVYTWALALSGPQAAQGVGLAYAAGALYLAWAWTRDLFGPRTAAWVAPLALAMPSALLLATGAYVDWALGFYTLAALYTAWLAALERAPWAAAGLFVGLAMSVKITSLPLPLAVGLYAWRRGGARAAVRALAVAGLVALPWYARNAYYMGNPFYPFVFGGYGWDAFRGRWLAEPGTGIGFQWREWLLLPWTVTLGHRDAAYFHSRIGPLWLGLAPLVVGAWTRRGRRGAARVRYGMQISALFVGLSLLLWAVGVSRSRALWQARFLWPALLAALPVTAYAVRWARVWNLPGRLRVHDVIAWMVLGVAGLTLLEWTAFVVGRHPTAYVLGLESEAAYYRRALPDYQDMRDLLAQHTPPTARVFFFFEPRSYGLPREVLPDANLDHWAWLWHHHRQPAAVAQALACQGWSHALVYRWGADFMRREFPTKFTPDMAMAWDAFVASLDLVATQGHYALYRLPAAKTYNCPPGAAPR